MNLKPICQTTPMSFGDDEDEEGEGEEMDMDMVGEEPRVS